MTYSGAAGNINKIIRGLFAYSFGEFLIKNHCCLIVFRIDKDEYYQRHE